MTLPDQSPKTLSEALVALQAHLPRVAKDQEARVTSQRTGKTHSYKYADLADVSEAILPLLAQHGLSFTAAPTIIEDSARFVLDYSLRHVSGEQTGGLYPLPASGSPQEIGSAITYARRYALCAVTGLAPGGDDDDAQAAERADGLPVNRDGSLARSQLTDEQRDQAGVMTSAQAREHGQLRKLDHPRPADRSNGSADDDQWAGQPAGEWQDATPEDKPGTSNSRQHRTLGIAYSALGITDRDARLTEMTNRVGRTITSAKDLSYQEADAAIKALEALVARREEAEAR